MFVARLVALAALVGCGGTEDLVAAADPDEGSTFTATITPEEGGTLTTASGGATLVFERGAVAEDVEISVEVLPPLPGTLAPVYKFGPEGAKFRNPGVLTLRATAEAEQAAVAWIDGSGDYVPLGGGLAAGSVSAPVYHFTPFTLIDTSNLSTSAFVRLHHMATITEHEQLTLEVVHGGATYLVASDQLWLTGGVPFEITNVGYGDPAEFLFKDADGNTLDSVSQPIEPGKQYGAIAVSTDLDSDVADRGVRGLVREFNIADVEAQYSPDDPRVFLTLIVPDPPSPPPLIQVQATSDGVTWEGPVPLPLGEYQFAEDASGFGITAFEVEGSGAQPGQPILCVDLRVPDLAALTEPALLMFITDDPARASASDPIVVWDTLNGDTQTRKGDFDLCP
jgi:hypothetical protein